MTPATGPPPTGPPPTGPTSRLPLLLLIARIAMAIATVSVCVVLVADATPAGADGSRAPNTIDAVVGIIATVALVVGAMLLLLAQIIAGHQAGAAIRVVGDPAAPSAWLGLRTRRGAMLAAFAILIVIVVSATMPQPRSRAEAAALFGLGAASLVLDTVSMGWACRHRRRYTSSPPPYPGADARVRTELTNSATISRVLAGLLLIALAMTIVEQAVRTPPQPAAALQIGTATLAALIPFVLAGALRALSRCVEGDIVDTLALRRAGTNLWLVVGAATVVATVTFIAVLRTDFADDQVPMYRAVAAVLVLLVAVLNCSSLSRLQPHDTPVRDSPKVPY
jgi:hypothetical protein